MYYVWCLKFGYNIGACESHAKYQKWLREDTLQHLGDCTSDPITCERCVLHDIEIDAQNIFNDILITIEKKSLGWCGSNCLSDCQFEVACPYHSKCIGAPCASGINICENPDHKDMEKLKTQCRCKDKYSRKSK
jgi:hypothetical protein